jgi:hypothetical protein
VRGWPIRSFSVAVVASIFTGCGGATHHSTAPSVEQTPAYKRGYDIGYNAVLSGRAEDCLPHSAVLRKSGRLKTKADVRDFVRGCNVGASDAVRTK